MGQEDGTPKTPTWAAEICGVPSRTIKALARQWAKKATTIATETEEATSVPATRTSLPALRSCSWPCRDWEAGAKPAQDDRMGLFSLNSQNPGRGRRRYRDDPGHL